MTGKFTIAKITAREILNGIGDPTVEADVVTASGTVGRASVPSGTSTGRHEAHELRDGGPRYGGRGVQKAVANVNDLVAPALVGLDVTRQRDVDQTMLDLDGTADKSRLGANAILAVSLAVADAAAKASEMPLYRYLGGPLGGTLPLPMANLMAGGAHAGNTLDFEDHLLFPLFEMSVAEATRGCVEIYRQLGVLLAGRFGSVRLVGGAYAPPLADEEEAFAVIEQAIREAGYEGRFGLGLDVAASGLYRPASGGYALARGEVSRAEMMALCQQTVAQHALTLVEDPLGEEDFAGFRELTERLPALVVGDDLFVTNRARLERGIALGAANAVLFKINQVGTLTEALETAATARQAGYAIVASVRSGESEDTAMVDMAVAVGARYVKFGAPARGERNVKYNRLLRIEEELATGQRVL